MQNKIPTQEELTELQWDTTIMLAVREGLPNDPPDVQWNYFELIKGKYPTKSSFWEQAIQSLVEEITP